MWTEVVNRIFRCSPALHVTLEDNDPKSTVAGLLKSAGLSKILVHKSPEKAASLLLSPVTAWQLRECRKQRHYKHKQGAVQSRLHGAFLTSDGYGPVCVKVTVFKEKPDGDGSVYRDRCSPGWREFPLTTIQPIRYFGAPTTVSMLWKKSPSAVSQKLLPKERLSDTLEKMFWRAFSLRGQAFVGWECEFDVFVYECTGDLKNPITPRYISAFSVRGRDEESERMRANPALWNVQTIKARRVVAVQKTSKRGFRYFLAERALGVPYLGGWEACSVLLKDASDLERSFLIGRWREAKGTEFRNITEFDVTSLGLESDKAVLDAGLNCLRTRHFLKVL